MSIDVFDRNLGFSNSSHSVYGESVIVLFRVVFLEFLPQVVQKVITSDKIVDFCRTAS